MKNIQNWFSGRVEDIADPLNLGRVRVRCSEYHNSDPQILRIDDLPWATVLSDTDNRTTTPVGLVVGDFVLGFFRDGDLCQDPVILARFPNNVTGYVNGQDISAAVDFIDPSRSSDWASVSQGLVISGGSTAYSTSSTPASSLMLPQEKVELSGKASEDLANTAHSKLGRFKETTKNWGAGFEQIWSATEISPSVARQKQLPWCAAFVCYAVKEANVLPEQKRPKTAKAYFLATQWAAQNPDVVARYQNPRDPALIKKGDIIIYNSSHAGICWTDAKPDGTFTMVDGNGFTGDVHISNRKMQNVVWSLRLKQPAAQQ